MKKIIFILTILLVSSAYAIPNIPHAFYGSVQVNAEPAEDGTVVTAKIGDIAYTAETIEGTYGQKSAFYVPGDDPDTSAREGGVKGDVITFYVDGVNAGTYEFQSGSSVNLDLSVDRDMDETADANDDNAVSGGGSSGVVATAPVQEPEAPEQESTGSPDSVPLAPDEEQEEPAPEVAEQPKPQDGAEDAQGMGSVTGNVVLEGSSPLFGFWLTAGILSVMLLGFYLYRKYM